MGVTIDDLLAEGRQANELANVIESVSEVHKKRLAFWKDDLAAPVYVNTSREFVALYNNIMLYRQVTPEFRKKLTEQISQLDIPSPSAKWAYMFIGGLAGSIAGFGLNSPFLLGAGCGTLAYSVVGYLIKDRRCSRISDHYREIVQKTPDEIFNNALQLLYNRR